MGRGFQTCHNGPHIFVLAFAEDFLEYGETQITFQQYVDYLTLSEQNRTIA